MGEIPKCTSWLGHKFSPRYSKGPSIFGGKYTGGNADVIAEKYRPVTYERDICVRCGVTIERPRAAPND